MDELLAKVVNIAHAAGNTILTYYRDTYAITDKAYDNPVTDADFAADSILKESLMPLLPEAGWLSEETVDNHGRLEQQYIWVVDPLDGTKEFILGIPEFSVSVALVKDCRPILSVVYNPPKGEMYYAQKGGGAFLENQKIRASHRSSMIGAEIGASRSERKRGEFSPFEETFRIKTLGSIAYKLAQVSAGRLDGTWSLGPKHEWDICAGVLLVEEAGGIAVDLDNQPFVFNQLHPKVNGIVATNGVLHEQIITTLALYRHEARLE